MLEKMELGRAAVRMEHRRAIDTSAATSEAIAIVGMSCRTPGGRQARRATGALPESGGDGVGPLPARWSRELLRRLEEVTGGLSQEGGFLDAVEDFDAGFFGISPREALAMDPQQRLVLEVAWEALERAGIRPGGAQRAAAPACISARWIGDYGTRSLSADDAGRLRRARAARAACCRGPRVLRAGSAGSGDDGGHGVLVVAGRAAPGVHGAAAGRVRPGAGGRRAR